MSGCTVFGRLVGYNEGSRSAHIMLDEAERRKTLPARMAAYILELMDEQGVAFSRSDRPKLQAGVVFTVRCRLNEHTGKFYVVATNVRGYPYPLERVQPVLSLPPVPPSPPPTPRSRGRWTRWEPARASEPAPLGPASASTPAAAVPAAASAPPPAVVHSVASLPLAPAAASTPATAVLGVGAPVQLVPVAASTPVPSMPAIPLWPPVREKRRAEQEAQELKARQEREHKRARFEADLAIVSGMLRGVQLL